MPRAPRSPLLTAVSTTKVLATLTTTDAGRDHASRETLADVQALRSYQAFLASMRERKANATSISSGLESTVLTRARGARDATRRLARTSLLRVQSLRTTDFGAELIRTVKEAGEIEPAREVAAIANDEEARRELRRAGLSSAILKDAIAALQKADIRVRPGAPGELLVTMAKGGEARVHVRKESVFRPGERGRTQPTAFQLLQQSAFDAIVDGFVSGALTASFPSTRQPDANRPINLDLFDTYALSWLAAHSELERHLRKLECNGSLDLHRGAAPALIIAIAVIVLAIGTALAVVGEVMLADCAAGAAAEVCDVGAVLAVVGYVLLAAAGAVFWFGGAPEFGVVLGFVSTIGWLTVLSRVI